MSNVSDAIRDREEAKRPKPVKKKKAEAVSIPYGTSKEKAPEPYGDS